MIPRCPGRIPEAAAYKERGESVGRTSTAYCWDNALAGDGEGHEFRDLEAYYDDYMHPLWREYRDHVVGGHDGIDYLVMRAFVEAVKARTAVPIDAYDMASWMAVSVLSEQSVAMAACRFRSRILLMAAG